LQELFFIFCVSGSGFESGSEEPEPWSLTQQTKEPGDIDLRFVSVLGGYQKEVENQLGFQVDSQLEYLRVSVRVMSFVKPFQRFSLLAI
jgi:hypothetical protein